MKDEIICSVCGAIIPKGHIRCVCDYYKTDTDNKKEGIKFDTKKLRWNLLPYECIEKIVEIYEFGAVKYGEENWKDLDEPKKRYFNALMRHLIEHVKGNKLDDETKKLHLAHAAWNILALLYFELNGE